MATAVWLVLPDPFPTSVFVDCGIVAEAVEPTVGAAGSRARALTRRCAEWAPRLGDVPWMLGADLFPADVGLGERVARRIDLAIDRNAGYYPLSVRHSLRNGFHRERMRPGHPNLFLDSSLTGRLPDSEHLDALMRRWLFSRRRYVSSALVQKMRSSVLRARDRERPEPPGRAVPERGSSARPACRRLRRELGPHRRQGDRLAAPRDATSSRTRPCATISSRYHGIARARSPSPAGRRPTSFTVDVRARRTTRSSLRCGLDPSRPLVLVAGNTPTNTPFEGRFVARMVDWCEGCRPSDRRSSSAPIHATGVARAFRSGARAHGRRRAGAAPTRTSTSSRRSSSTAIAWSRTRARSCSTRSSTTVRPSASSTTRALRPARGTRCRTSSASTTASSLGSDAFYGPATSRRSSPGSSVRSSSPTSSRTSASRRA